MDIGMATKGILEQKMKRQLEAVGGGPNPFGGGPNPFGGGGDPARPETADTMVEKLRHRAGHGFDRHGAMRKLAELKDARAPGPIASYLPEFFDRGPATDALRQ